MFSLFSYIIEEVGLEKTIINFIVTLGIFLIYFRVIKNFKQAKKQEKLKQKEVKSIVETASMSRFFLIVLYSYSIWYWKI